MTKGGSRLAAALALASCALLALPSALAHGAPPVRDVDTRVLLDDDGPLGFGGCVEGTCALPQGGLDLLALDVREAHLPDGAPAIVFRFIMQSEADLSGKSLAFHVTAGGAAQQFALATTDGIVWTSPDFDRVDPAVDVGDGHPKAVDAWVRHSVLGVKAGDALSDISVDSASGSTQEDVMPGGWFFEGAPVSDPTSSPDLPSYTVKGPAALVALAADPGQVQSRGVVVLRVTSQAGLPQFVDLTLQAPNGTTARLWDPLESTCRHASLSIL